VSGLDTAARYVVSCQVGLRGFVAERILKQHGFQVANLSGGYLTWKQFNAPPVAEQNKRDGGAGMDESGRKAEGSEGLMPPPLVRLDVRALACPGPVVRLKQAMEELKAGETLELMAALSFACDLTGWAQSSGNDVMSVVKKEDHLVAIVRKGRPDACPTACAAGAGKDGAAIILFSNDLDKVMAALIIACGMAAAGEKVGLFFTFWGLSVLRKNPGPKIRKPLLARMFGWMLPNGATKLALSKMHMAGMGTQMMHYVMRQQQVLTVPALLDEARTLGVRFIACEMAMNVMGLTREELVTVDDVAGIASFAQMAKQSGTTLFI